MNTDSQIQNHRYPIFGPVSRKIFNLETRIFHHIDSHKEVVLTFFKICSDTSDFHSLTCTLMCAELTARSE